MTTRPQGLTPHAAGPLGLRGVGLNLPLWLPRILLVLVVALVMLGFADNLWAQQDNPYSFPFIDPNENRARMLANAFSVQMGLFMGGVGGIPALTMLGMVAALVGGITLVFRRDFSPAIISTWLLVVAIVIFVPLNSSLLFTPIKVSNPPTPTNVTPDGARLSEKNLFNGAPCSTGESWKGCGFTPQLVAVHLTSVVQVILSDLFRSRGWRGLIEREAANSLLRTRPELKLSEAWLHQSNRFVQQCSGQTSLASMLANTRGGTPTTTTPSAAPTPEPATPHEFGELWDRWRNEFSGNRDHNKPPFIAILPETLAQAEQFGWGATENELHRKYLLALTTVFNNLMNRGRTVSVQFTVRDPRNEISVKDALDALKYKGFLQVSSLTGLTRVRESPDTSINPGFFMISFSDASETSSQQAMSRVCYMNDMATSDTWGQWILDTASAVGSVANANISNPTRRACLNPVSGAFSSGWGSAVNVPTALVATVTGLGFNAGNWFGVTNTSLSASEMANRALIWGSPENHWTTYAFIDGRVTQGRNETATFTEPWRAFINSWALLRSMPVIFGDPLRNQKLGQGVGPFKPRAFEPLASQTCQHLGEDLLTEAIRTMGSSTEGGVQRDNLLSPYFKMLNGTGTIPDTIEVRDLITGTTETNLQRSNANRYAFIKMLADDANNTLLTSGARGQSPEIKQAALVNRFVRLAQDVTAQAYPNINRSASAIAARDGRNMNPSLVGSETITEIGGNLAFGIGGALIWAYSWLMGPLAFATIQFLNVMIDLCLYAVIVLTPLLLLAGVLQPRKALGYLIITVIVVFVLKFVPITLIILNSIAGMVYELLPSALGMNASLAQSMMMIGLATIYMSLIGFTLYLIFKSGDPTSTVGALANLDSAAKQAAEAGMKYGLAAAGLATSLGLGMAFAAVKGTSMKAAVKRELKKIPGVGDLLERNEIGNKEREKQQRAAIAERNNMYGEFVDDGKSINKGPQNTGPNDIMTTPYNQNINSADVNASYYDPMRVEAAERLENLSNDERDSITNHLKEVGSDKGVLLGTASDGREIVARLNGAGDIVATIEPPLEDPMPYIPKAVTGAPPPDGTNSNEANADGGEDANNENQTTNPDAAASIAAAQNAQANTVILAAGNQTAPLPVDVVKGKLESVEKLPEVKMAEIKQPDNLSAEQRLQQIDKQRADKRTAQENQQLEVIRDKMAAETDPEKKKLLDQYQAAILSGDNDAAKKIDKELRDKDLTEDERKAGLHAKTFTELQLKRDADIKNYENQIQEWRSQVQSQLKIYDGKDDKSLSRDELNHKKTLLNAMDLLNKSDGIAFNMADRFKALSEGKDALRRATLQADILNLPGAGKVAMSALYGWGAGLFSGGGSIPVIGNVIREISNEYLQAPERAKAWNAAGGAYKWWKAQTKASQMGYYSKEVAPLAAAAQYDAMSSMGMFEGNIRLAQQAATEAVARSRSDYEALNMRLRNVETFDKDINVTVEPRKFLNANDLYGLGLENSITRINTVYQEALQGRQGTIDVVQAKYNKDGIFTGEEKVTIRKTAEISSEISQRIIAKGFGGAFDASMLKYYGLSEKRDRGGEYDNVRDAESAKAQVEIARLDAEANYLVGGHINMVQGKADFFGYRGKYQAYNELRNQSNTMVHDYIKANAAALNVPLNLVPQINQTQYNAAVKAATEAIGKINLPLNGVFEEAQSSGYSNVIVKSRIARFNLDKMYSDNDEAVSKAAKAAFDALNSDVDSKFGKKRTIEFARTRNELGDGREELINKIMYYGKQSNQDVERMIDISNKTAKDYQKSFQMEMSKLFKKDKFGNLIKDSNGKAIEIGVQAIQTTTKDFVDAYIKETEAQLGKVAGDAARKVFKDLGNGKYEIAFAAIEAKDDGKIDTPVR